MTNITKTQLNKLIKKADGDWDMLIWLLDGYWMKLKEKYKCPFCGHDKYNEKLSGLVCKKCGKAVK